MSYEIDVLRTLFRFSKQKKTPALEDLGVRVGVDANAVRRALFTLSQAGLVQRTPGGLRLTLAGLAIAVATGERRRRAKSLPRIVRSTSRKRAA